MPREVLQATHDAAGGAILGALVGDSIGSYLEFVTNVPREKVEKALTMPGGGHWGVSPGQVTDDGEMTLSLMRAIIASNGVDADGIARGYAAWSHSKPFDMGRATSAALDAAGHAPQKATAKSIRARAAVNSRTKSNGSMMRATPIGVVGWAMRPDQVARVAQLDCAMTHPNHSVVLSVSMYCIAMAHLVGNAGDVDGAIAVAVEWLDTRKAKDQEAYAEVSGWIAEALSETKPPIPFGPEIGFVKYAFQHAFRHLKIRTPYPTAIEQVLAGGGDTDTNCCIVGGLLGAAQGVTAIPSVWREAVLLCTTEAKLMRRRPEFLRPGPGLLDEIAELVRIGSVAAAQQNTTVGAVEEAAQTVADEETAE